jgi:hypothetical protein
MVEGDTVLFVVLPAIITDKVKGPSEALQGFLQDLVLLSASIQLELQSSLHVLIRVISKPTQIFYHIYGVFANGKDCNQRKPCVVEQNQFTAVFRQLVAIALKRA